MIKIPNFTIEKEIGYGGMATVYLALQDMLGRLVALKVLLPEMMRDENVRKNFLSEGQIVASLDHPNIVRIHDIGIVEEKIFFMSMEYLSGGTLKDKIIRGKLSLSEAVHILDEMADGLTYAHQKGYIHRDIKPSNILFRDTGEAVITDFGIAKLQDTSGELTQLGFTKGTVQYMSPEQATTTNLDSRTDIYSLGLIFYEMLTGLKAFKAESNIQAIHQHTTAPPPDLPKEYAYLQKVINKVLAKEPESRYQTASEFIQAVKQASVSKPAKKVSSTIHTDKTIIHQINDIPVKNSVDKRFFTKLGSEKEPEKKKLLISGILGALGLIGLIAFGVINLTNDDHGPDKVTALKLTQIELGKQERLEQERKTQELTEKIKIEKKLEQERIKSELIASKKLKEEQQALELLKAQELEKAKLEADKKEAEAKRVAEEKQQQEEEELARKNAALAKAEQERKEKEQLEKKKAELEAEKQREIAERKELLKNLPNEALEAHNRIRIEHNQKPFVWSKDLAQISQDWADKLASTCEIYHHPGEQLPFGESLFIKEHSTTIDEAVNAWVSEKEFYNYQQNTCQIGKECGHYTQIVWKGTTDVGCGVQSCSDGSQIWVCEYFPAGNYIGARPF